MARTGPAPFRASGSAAGSQTSTAVTSLSEPVRSREQLLYRLCSTTPARLGWAFRDRSRLANPWTEPGNGPLSSHSA